MKFYQKFFASRYDSFMHSIEQEFYSVREELLADLEGTILDVGSGTGANFEHFHANARVIAVEPSEYMLEKSLTKLPAKATIETHHLSVTDDAVDDIIPDHSLDFVVCTLVLCTIPDQQLALQKFKQWLKPDGKLIVLEHIHAEHNPNRFLQNLINPIWKVVGEGCHLNRDTDKTIKEAGFLPESETYFKRSLRFYQGVFSV